MPELVDEIRVPLHELQADVDYLIGRVIADPTCAPTITASIKGKLAAIEAAALILNEPQAAREGLAAELMAFHDACTMDGQGGDGQFRIICSSGSSEQAMALRAVLREAAAALSLTRPQSK